MTLVGFMILLLIAAVIGTIGQGLAGYSLGGCLVSAIVGLIGAFLGYWLADTLRLPPLVMVRIDGAAFPFVWAIVGSTLLVVLVGLVSGRSKLDAL